VQEEQRIALDERPGHLSAVITTVRLDLDDIGTEIGKGSGDCGSSEKRHLDDSETLERSTR
jgi:hypothetical protein